MSIKHMLHKHSKPNAQGRLTVNELETLVNEINEGNRQELLDDLSVPANEDAMVTYQLTNEDEKIRTCYSAILSGIKEINGYVKIKPQEDSKYNVDADLLNEYPELKNYFNKDKKF